MCLIPRHETELLVEKSLDLLPKKSMCKLLELGTGSGAVALALASERADCKITATDISKGALDIARVNQATLGFRNIQWIQSDWFTAIQDARFDLICSNPPYIEVR